MKPDKIFLVRHGQSEGNVSRTIYKTTPDYALKLTELGKNQVLEAGDKISKLIDLNDSIQYYTSPFWRTRQTYTLLRKKINNKNVYYYEDPRLREQNWGGQIGEIEAYKREEEQARDAYGHFYYQFKGGESVAQCVDRASDFLGTMFRDFEKKNFPNIAIITSHGMFIRAFLMRFFHCSVEEFESWGNPRNAEFFVLEKQKDEKYKLITPLRIHEIKHKFQYPFTEWDIENGYAKRKLSTHEIKS